EGYHTAYALVRPPGHHAERDVFGGFCYFNNSSIAANFLSKYGKIAILDIDYHHGNGHQQIFYDRKDVFTVSIHGNPSFAYPYFTGFADERGEGEGQGFNLNLPLKKAISGKEYLVYLKKAIKAIKAFNPDYLIVSLGFDPAKGDPTGTWSLTSADFANNGVLLGKLLYPVLFVQEGGYKNRTLGVNARHFFQGYLSTGAVKKL
ncbi:MAG: histone deacetylase family protein, partial [Deltaproteobacteria bacterium]|nr:histone deacetylase family protein [Candidatus Desulfobacula maris]